MSKEFGCTIDDDLFKEVLIWNRHRHGPNARLSEYAKVSMRALARRDRAAWEKNHPKGSSPDDTPPQAADPST